MSNTFAVGPTGNQRIDGVLVGEAFSGTTMTYRFPTSEFEYYGDSGGNYSFSGFQSFNASQIAAALDGMALISAYTGLNFVSSTATNVNLRFAEADVVDTKFVGTAFAYTPSTNAWAGDSFYNTFDFNNPTEGSYAYATILHELGHAMGLSHGHDPSEDYGALPSQYDSLEYSIMTYRSYINGPSSGGYTADFFPETYMSSDIAALQTMYGANFNTASGNTTYTFNPGDGTSLETIWDGGGTDTYDFSGYGSSANLTIDLEPGWASGFGSGNEAVLDFNSGTTAAGIVFNSLLYNGDTRSLIENAIGGAGNDFMYGNQVSNRLEGGAGADAMFGFRGNDVLIGGTGIDTMYGGLGSDVYYVDNAADEVIENAGEGTDTVYSSVSYELRTFSQFTENLSLTGTTNINATGNGSANVISGNAGNNTLNGATGNDILYGGDGNDIFQDDSGTEQMYGGTGNDIYYVDNYLDAAIEYANRGYDQVISTGNYALRDHSQHVESLKLVGNANLTGIGNGQDNVLIGNNGNNLLNGASGNDIIYGGNGNDTFQDDAGVDQMYGGVGNDTYYVDNVNDETIEYVNRGIDSVISSVSYSLRDSSQHTENLTLTGNQNLYGTGNGSDNAIAGNNGSNVLNGAYGNDTLYGGNGNDVFQDDFGVDQMYGGQGNDIYYVDDVNDVTIEYSNRGTDLVISSVDFQLYNVSQHIENISLSGIANIDAAGNALNNVISGNSGNNGLFGGSGNDTLYGGNGNDDLQGNSGVDVMYGGSGDDVYFVDNYLDAVFEYENRGIDVVVSTGNYDLSAYTQHVEELNLVGTANINGYGNGADNFISGNSGNNILRGYRGDDVLIGGEGNDIMTGGTGADIFAVASEYYPFEGPGTVEAYSGFGSDTVTDFNVNEDALEIYFYDVLFGTSTTLFDLQNGTGPGTIYQSGSNVVIEDGQSSSIVLEDVQLSTLTEDNFV